MKYYLDTEFLEGTQKERFPISLFRKNTPPTIDLISIGIVSESYPLNKLDGDVSKYSSSREYYAISKDFNLKEAWNRFQIEEQTPYEKQNGFSGRKIYWMRENVLKPIFDELFSKSLVDKGNFVENNFFTAYSGFTYGHLKALINYYGKTNKEIAEEIKDFCKWKSIYNEQTEITTHFQDTNPEFYAYFADYDWVVFCWIFGKMMDLPKGFPMYCKDLKQILDEKQPIQHQKTGNAVVVNNAKLQYHANFPKQDPSKAHNALEDARWNKKLHEFLKSI